MRRRSFWTWVAVALGLLACPGVCFGQSDEPVDVSALLTDHGIAINTAWVLVTAFLVFFMQAGFGILEAGLVRAKNTCNILMKNFLDFAFAAIAFFAIGYALMYGDGNDFFGASGWFLIGLEENAGLPIWVFWLFQVVFCGTAATIVSGCVAERMRFQAYLIYSVLISMFVYPIVGHWVWGGGWLSQLGFTDFAGSGVVHAVGGFAGLVGAMMLGPRIGKYSRDGRPRVLAGHTIPLAALDVFILWFGWYGFNPGSTLGLTGGNAALAGMVAMNTTLAAAAGAISAMFVVWSLYGKPDLTMTMNGLLAGLVAITAPCAAVSPVSSIVIGLVAGILVVAGVRLLDNLKIDDPVGAWSVHGLNGIWGVLAVGLFATEGGVLTGGGVHLIAIQALGAAAIVAWTVVTMVVVFGAIKATVGLRVSGDEELRGLDIGEHGQEAYAGFEIFVTT
ncbi:MAG: ammonium transporter [Phycisphaerae bacterium]|nr:ammonium transporter [Phycisphaerae bacterium]